MTLLFLTVILNLLPLIQSRPQQGLVGADTATSSSAGATTWTPWAVRRAVAMLSGSSARRHDGESTALHRRDGPGARPSDPLSIPVWHSDEHRLEKRAGIDLPVSNRSDVSYYTQLFLGNPPQKVIVQLDTGSSELWVNPDCTNLLSAQQDFCKTSGRYDATASSTADTTIATNKTLQYGIGSAVITYVLDDIRLSENPSPVIRQVQYGCAQQSEKQVSGVLGLGFGKGFNTRYDTFLDSLAAQQGWNATIFSLALGTKGEKQGLITFGGVDTSKFAGALVPQPIVRPAGSSDKMARYWLRLQSVVLADPKMATANLTQRPATVFLDSGSTNSYLSPEVVRAMRSVFNATRAGPDGAPIVNCSWVGRQGGFDFAFQGITIHVPYRELIRPPLNSTSPSATCYLGVLPSTTFALLGASFMRSAYVTFDLSARKTYLAPYSNCGSTPIGVTVSAVLDGLTGRCNVQDPKQAWDQTMAMASTLDSSAASVYGWKSCNVGVLLCLAHVGMLLGSVWRPQPV